jgi:hypothetical protein
MRGGLAVAGTAIAGALCCLAIPITVAIAGFSDLAAFGANLGLVAIIAAAIIFIVLRRTPAGEGRSRADG